ncbi:MAG: nucleoside recognition protein [Desulfobacteraceae bacterium]|nr:nucleoside recognition protein [Desulfobacteraceae bacterium]
MSRQKANPRNAALFASFAVSTAILIFGAFTIDDLSSQKILYRLLVPLARLMIFIGIGLAAGEIIESTGWTRHLSVLARPLFKFGKLGNRCSAAFTTAFISGVAANAMLLDFYKDDKITKKQLFLTNFVNQLPAYFLHLPTTFFIVIPLTGLAGALYFLITFAATLLRIILFLIYGHFSMTYEKNTKDVSAANSPESKKKSLGEILKTIKNKFPRRITGIAMYVIPIYTFVFVINNLGFFEFARKWLAGFIISTFMPVEALSVVILSFAAEFTSGFAAAGALLDAGVLTIKQTVLALLIGNIAAFPFRALRHQLPRYMGIFSPKMGSQLLFMGQGFRMLSLIIVGMIYYYIG